MQPMIKSKALEVNLADYHVDVAVDEKYLILQDIMSRYYGLMDGFNTFLKELSHPYRNWNFIVAEARRYGLEYFHLLDSHPNGPEGFGLFVDIFLEAIDSSPKVEVRAEAADNLLLFLQKAVRDGKSGIDRFMPVLDQAFEKIGRYDGETFFLFVKSYYQLNKLGEYMLARSGEISAGFEAINSLILKYFRTTYAYWLGNKDPARWFAEEAGLSLSEEHKKEVAPLFEDNSHQQIDALHQKLERIATSADLSSVEVLRDCTELVGYGRIVEAYRRLPRQLLNTGGKTGRGKEWKVVFLFHMMSISGLSMIHEEVLRDINRTVSWLIGHETRMNIRKLLQKTFAILATQTVSYPATALNCVLNMGRGVFQTDQSDLINYFLDQVIEMGFQSPRISGVGNDWQIRANSAHIQNIRTWLELIELNPKWSTQLLSVLIVHLALSGIFIKDTDLFPRDVTRLLNSDIGPVYNLIKQLTRLFPVFFNDIGAEGQLRDISTQVDEITRRKDRLIHFVRKQSHVESSNQIIGLLDAVWQFWATGSKEGLQSHVPADVFEQIQESGELIDGAKQVVAQLAAGGIEVPGGLIRIGREQLRQRIDTAPGVRKIDKERVLLLADFYKLVCQKYNFDAVELNSYISQLSTEAIPDLSRLKMSLEEPDLKKKLFQLLDYLKQLKSIILSPDAYEVREDIYKKRHITIDIPSMYGSYHEMKFDALGLTFRIESVVNVLFEELVENIDLSLITKATFYSIYARIRLFDKALRLDGISSVEIERQLDLLAHSLEIKGFSFTQYLDIFKGFTVAVRNIINDYFHNVHEQNLARILENLPVEQIAAKYLPQDGDRSQGREKLVHRVSEIFFRDRIALSLGLQQLDRFISRILHILYQQADKLPKDKLHQLLIYDPENALTAIHQPNNRVSDLIFLGNKGLNLLYLRNLGLPVPPGFIITTEVFRCREMMESYPPAEKNFRERIARQISGLEESTGKAFGDPRNPLLLSVRSGSSISQPGMMDTFLNVGMNNEIVAGLAARSGNEWFAWDNYRRFLQCYGMIFGLERDEFDAIISELKRRVGIDYKRDFTGAQMKKAALTYKRLIQDSGIHIFEDSFEQLYHTIKYVFDSWESDKARTYRKIMGISDDWGTAVTVQSMVFGNLSESSGSGVVFTHSPRQPGGSPHLWGDFTLGNQGEDVVAGLVITLPISINQQDIEMRQTDVTLESHFPEIYNALQQWSSYLIYEKGWTPQEMEFTFESPSLDHLYILQCRDMVMRERKKVPRFDLDQVTEDQYLGHGIGIGGGAMSGRVVFSLEEIDHWRASEPQTNVILIRSDTVPDDIRQIYAADGLLTARGGVTSHASVVAHRLGKTCVVGCGDLLCDEKARNCKLKGMVIQSGEFISIDGQEGSVYLGKLKINKNEL
jgi:pyruvate,orthophosphate dikinase